MAINTESRFIQKFMSFINHYDHEKYWKRREVVVNPDIPASRIKRLYYLFYIKKVDSYWHCTFGTNYLAGSKFITPPHFISRLFYTFAKIIAFQTLSNSK